MDALDFMNQLGNPGGNVFRRVQDQYANMMQQSNVPMRPTQNVVPTHGTYGGGFFQPPVQQPEQNKPQETLKTATHQVTDALEFMSQGDSKDGGLKGSGVEQAWDDSKGFWGNVGAFGANVATGLGIAGAMASPTGLGSAIATAGLSKHNVLDGATGGTAAMRPDTRVKTALGWNDDSSSAPSDLGMGNWGETNPYEQSYEEVAQDVSRSFEGLGSRGSSESGFGEDRNGNENVGGAGTSSDVSSDDYY